MSAIGVRYQVSGISWVEYGVWSVVGVGAHLAVGRSTAASELKLCGYADVTLALTAIRL
jgi:hypothetical protein